MPDTNPEIIKNSLLYDFTEVVRCEDCDSVLDQNLSYFYFKCLLRKLDCFSEVLRSSCLRDDYIFLFVSFNPEWQSISCNLITFQG